MKEYGGYISIESYGNEYYEESATMKVLRLNIARYAIVEAIKDGRFARVWVPIYTCKSIYDALEREKIKYSTYNIDNLFEPQVENIGEDECIIITNYFGIKDEVFYIQMTKKYKNIIWRLPPLIL